MTDLLKAAGREYTLFVEPQDFEAYKAHHENVIELEENNRVIGFARLSIQNFAPRGLGWILDDDIRELFQVLPNGKMFSQNVLSMVESDFPDDRSVGIAGLHYSIWAARAKTDEPLNYNTIPTVAVLVNWDRVAEADARDDPGLKVHEDVNFAFQLFKTGFQIVRFKHYAMKPADNRIHRDCAAMSAKMVERWPE